MIRERGLTQRWVARQLGATDVQFSRMLLGKRPIPVNVRIVLARILRVKRADIESIITNGESK